ncbi:MAG TPA: NAD(P)-dependent alcohol dehydrogenase [Gemmatimonadales bacterium]|nr:NAD(P)-dependent alcohol dehydrogenase [Gemmatimonadota bacterium]MCA9767940.1 NAD(P)-dependent alcohol dehydrogenase [Gemmatimonadota bacterium]MCB9504641.1 NAD(P)-dependent alcohol dehydrogenase [Gemmatimonadales bacterium]HPF61097.1 NAD(P)-dependent alcohol dehydrogenase [Gemmatimonadales bacterium]HRX17823.1 NAD(P)-dependent alcohol dehydrogenase [Gemmatimonadales bacterium]
MLAAWCPRYGPPEVLDVREVPAPTPADGEIAIAISHATVTSGDRRIRALDVPLGFKTLSRLMFGFRRPRRPILGMEAAGTVTEVGHGVTAFAPGDRVFVFDGSGMGCWATQKCIAADGPVVRIPDGVDDEQAAALAFGGTTMLDFYRRGALQAGERVLVNGASGGVGTAAVQLGRVQGAEVTAVCSTRNIELVRELGATSIIDYTTTDVATTGQTFDMIVDTAGTMPFGRARRLLRPGGRLLVVLGTLLDMVAAPWRSRTTPFRVVAGPASVHREDMETIARLAASGDYHAVIDRRFPLSEIVAAHRHVDTGHKRGNVILMMPSPA